MSSVVLLHSSAASARQWDALEGTLCDFDFIEAKCVAQMLYELLGDLHDALDECFHQKGGLKYLYTLFPGGPIAQSCRLAGLKAPFIATDRSFGSVA